VLQSSPAIDPEEQKKINHEVVAIKQKLHKILNTPKRAVMKGKQMPSNKFSHSKSAVQDTKQVSHSCQHPLVSTTAECVSHPMRVLSQAKDVQQKSLISDIITTTPSKECPSSNRLPSIILKSLEASTENDILAPIHSDLSNCKKLPTLEPQPLKCSTVLLFGSNELMYYNM